MKHYDRDVLKHVYVITYMTLFFPVILLLIVLGLFLSLVQRFYVFLHLTHCSWSHGHGLITLPLFFCVPTRPLQAEARLAAKRAARAEAREIRMRELERQQKEVKKHKH